MTCKPTRTLTIQHRHTGEVATVMDVSGMTESELDKVRTGLVRKVDFEKWQVIDEVVPGEDDLAATRNAADPAVRRSIATIRETDYRGANT